MTFIVGLVCVICLNLALSEDISRSEHCDVLDKVHLEDELDKLLQNLPSEYVVKDTKGEILTGAVFTEESLLYGLDELMPDRPFNVFCRGDDIVTLFSLRSRFPMRMRTPWRLCSGHNGTVVTSVDHVRYEGEFVTSKTGNGTTPSIENMMPVMLETMNFRMEDAGDTVSTIVNVLGHVLSGPVRMFWVEIMTPFVQEAFRETLRESS